METRSQISESLLTCRIFKSVVSKADTLRRRRVRNPSSHSRFLTVKVGQGGARWDKVGQGGRLHLQLFGDPFPSPPRGGDDTTSYS